MFCAQKITSNAQEWLNCCVLLCFTYHKNFDAFKSIFRPEIEENVKSGGSVYKMFVFRGLALRGEILIYSITFETDYVYSVDLGKLFSYSFPPPKILES